MSFARVFSSQTTVAPVFSSATLAEWVEVTIVIDYSRWMLFPSSVPQPRRKSASIVLFIISPSEFGGGVPNRSATEKRSRNAMIRLIIGLSMVNQRPMLVTKGAMCVHTSFIFVKPRRLCRVERSLFAQRAAQLGQGNVLYWRMRSR